MKPSDIVIYARKKLRSAEVLEIIDEINNFFRDDWLEVRWNYRYDIETYYSGTATSAAATMTDSAASFAVDGTLIGQSILNTTDGSSGTITAVTANVITATLSGGTNNTWAVSDAYTISLTNNIRIPKTINRVIAVYLGTARVFGSLSDIALLNSTGSTADPYSDNIYTPSPSSQAVVIRDGYIMSFVFDIEVTNNITIICEKIFDEITIDDISTAFDIPDKFTMPIAFYVLKELYDYEKYYNRQKKMDYEYKFNKRIKSAKKSIAIERTNNTVSGKVGSKEPYQHGTVLV